MTDSVCVMQGSKEGTAAAGTKGERSPSRQPWSRFGVGRIAEGCFPAIPWGTKPWDNQEGQQRALETFMLPLLCHKEWQVLLPNKIIEKAWIFWRNTIQICCKPRWLVPRLCPLVPPWWGGVPQSRTTPCPSLTDTGLLGLASKFSRSWGRRRKQGLVIIHQNYSQLHPNSSQFINSRTVVHWTAKFNFIDK